jgi:hypothetical protein
MANDRAQRIIDKLKARKAEQKTAQPQNTAPSPAAEVQKFKSVTEISPKSKLAEYIGKDFDNKEIEWKETCRYLFCNWKVIADSAKEYAGKDIPRELIENPSLSARHYADSLVANLEKAAEEVGSSIRYLSPIVIDGLPGGHLTPPLGSVVLGLIRKEDGLVSPVVVNVELLLLQSGSGHAATRYDANTNLGAILRNVLTDASYI